MDEIDADRAEADLRGILRSRGLAWLEQQVDEGLGHSSGDRSEPPKPSARLAALAEAVAFAFELVEMTEAGTVELLLGEGAAPDRPFKIEAVEFADPLGREEPRRLARRDDPETTSAIWALRAATDVLTGALEPHEKQ